MPNETRTYLNFKAPGGPYSKGTSMRHPTNGVWVIVARQHGVQLVRKAIHGTFGEDAVGRGRNIGKVHIGMSFHLVLFILAVACPFFLQGHGTRAGIQAFKVPVPTRRNSMFQKVLPRRRPSRCSSSSVRKRRLLWRGKTSIQLHLFRFFFNSCQVHLKQEVDD